MYNAVLTTANQQGLISWNAKDRQRINSLTGDQRLFAKSIVRLALHFTLFSDGAKHRSFPVKFPRSHSRAKLIDSPGPGCKKHLKIKGTRSYYFKTIGYYCSRTKVKSPLILRRFYATWPWGADEFLKHPPLQNSVWKIYLKFNKSVFRAPGLESPQWLKVFPFVFDITNICFLKIRLSRLLIQL